MDWAKLLQIVQLIELVLKQLVGSGGRSAARSAGGPAPDKDKIAQEIAAYLQTDADPSGGSANLARG